jgi:hypothetical protein
MSNTLLEESELGDMMSFSDDIILMKCPFCNHDIPALWQPLLANTDEVGRQQPNFRSELISEIPSDRDGARNVTIKAQWLKCSNAECRQIIVQVIRIDRTMPATSGIGIKLHSHETWIAVPKKPNVPQPDPLIPDKYSGDYREAFSILEDSPKMSAVLSRRILATLLNEYGGFKNYKLSNAVKKFIDNTSNPSRLRENLHYLREIADFGAHPQKDEDDNVIDVTKEEAQWTLKVIEDLFDYYIVGPARDKKLRSSFDKKLEAANRKPIKPLGEDKEENEPKTTGDATVQ